jgi:hypothetical protein
VIRFIPDTWLDAVMRPIAMAAPDAAVYIEIMAPDFRFVFILVAALALGIVHWRGPWQLSPTVKLFAFVAAAFIPWLATSGNGRYFIPVLLMAGPVAVALIYRLPVTRELRCLLAVLAVALQGGAVYLANPWHNWGWATWRNSPAFALELDSQAKSTAPTYVTLAGISYSLIAPRFPEAARWTNVSGLSPGGNSPDAPRVQRFLAEASELKLLVPILSSGQTPEGLPNADARSALNEFLSPHRLSLQDPSNCRLLRSRGLAEIALRNLEQFDARTVDKFGFWACELKYPVDLPQVPPPAKNLRVEAAFEKLEKTCPRIFHGGATAVRIPEGSLRVYSGSDTKAYVLSDGRVLYKYYRSLNSVLLGSVDEVLGDGFKMDCNAIRGRSGLPWERGI